MTLDPIHVDNIARLASAIAGTVDDSDHDDHAERAWELLNPLYENGRKVVEPLGEHRLRRADIDDVALAERPFETSHGVDSGTLNPTAFKNGLMLDVAQAAMGAVPSDLDVHRSRSLVATVHTSDATRDYSQDWTSYDEGHSQRRILHVPSVGRFADEVVHELALYLAESEHAHLHANVVSDLLFLDGPLYPKRLFNWESRDAELAEVAREASPRQIVENYVRLVEAFVEKDVPLAGFVKNATSRFVVRTVGEKAAAPWPNDAALFTRLLELREDDGTGSTERVEDDLTFTSWFVSRGSSDEPVSAAGDALGIERRLDPREYEVTFFYLYDPRQDVCYKVEAPYAFTKDETVREALTMQVVSEVATERGPPRAVGKADELARIGVGEKDAIRRKFEERFDSESLRTYDDVRWDDEEY